jgi:hypothetical protein
MKATPSPQKNPHAVALGRKGGQATTAKKIAAAKLNGSKGGRRKAAALAIVVLAAIVFAGCDGAKLNPVAPSATITASNLTLAVQPSALLLSGSTVTITARVRDDKGTNAVGSQVTFTSNVGSLNHTIVTSDGTGFATVELTAAEAAYVTVSTMNGTGALAIPAVAPYSVTIAPQSAVTVNQAAAMVVTVTPNRTIVSPPSPESVSVSCGPGLPLVTMTGLSRSCTFSEVGSTLVSVSAPSANGWTAASSNAVTVNAVATTPTVPAPAPPATPDPTLGAVIGCTAANSLHVACNVQSLTFGSSAVPVETITEVKWEWGDSVQDRGTAFVIGHDYAQTGTYQLRVTVLVPVDGSERRAVVVQNVIVPKP